MNASQLILLVFVLFVFWFLPALGVCLLFRKAGVAGWKGFIPVYNNLVMVQLSERPWYWVILQFVPVIGIFFSLAIGIEFIKTFGKTRFYQYALIAVSFGYYFLFVGLNPRDKFVGPGDLAGSGDAAAPGHTGASPRSGIWEWIGAGAIAIVFITLLRAFVFETYTLPTMSMERSLMRGDYLFVSKLSYGPRVPNTPLSIPFFPGIFPVDKSKIYTESIKFPYSRLFSSPVRRWDVVVFNFPYGDTVINLADYQSMRPYYDVIRELGRGNADSGRQLVLSNPDDYPLVVRPVDKRENYMKRCVAVAGDTLQIRDQVFYIDGKAQPFTPESETYFQVETKGQPLDETSIKEEYKIDINDPEDFRSLDSANRYAALLTWTTRDKMLKDGFALKITPDIDSSEEGIFPIDGIHHWTRDNYGPIWIPRKGATLELTPENYAIYERAVRVYEGNKLEMKSGKIYLNDREESKYTFKMDYYWMIGDNLHGSQDSRYWGFVPEDHVIGKASLIGMSLGNGVRWDRVFKWVE